MKLLLITCVGEYQQNVTEILRHSGVKSFSYQMVNGYENKNGGKSHNWFIAEDVATDSLLFTVFIEDACQADIVELVRDFNAQLTSSSKVHLACLAVEESV